MNMDMYNKIHKNTRIKIKDIDNIIFKKYKYIKKIKCYGEKSYFYNKDNNKKRGKYFITIKEYDGPNDKQSNLDRDNTYRLTYRLSKEEYKNRFGKLHKKIDNISKKYKFDILNTITPHPIYYWMNFIQIINPKYNMLKQIITDIDDLYSNYNT